MCIEEIERGPRPIEGVPTSTAAFLGETERGAITPRLVTSYQEYVRWFGDVFGTDRFLPDTINGFFENGGKRAFIARVTGEGAAVASSAFGDFSIQAAGPGAWGSRVFARIDRGTTKKADGTSVGFRLRLAYLSDPAPDFDPFLPESPTTSPAPALIEDFDDLVTDEASPDYYGKRTEGSALGVLIRNAGAAPDATPADGATLLLGGTDATSPLDADDYSGLPTAARATPQGLAALELEPYRETALVYAPAVGDEVLFAVLDHCERLRFRFAVVDAPSGIEDASQLDPRSTLRDSQYAALYYPWIAVDDSRTGARRLIPPGGHVLGVYARTDSERGVFKAPANEALLGVADLEYAIDQGTQEVLNPRGVNVIRNFPGRGILVWGARTISSDASWKYVSVRRLFIFLERSIYEGLQWVVFEPNDKMLWARVIDTIRLFLVGQWRLGALWGRTEQEAFFIKCDRTTMTADDILNGRLICEIGIAPVRPAEFVVFRIFQSTAESQGPE